MFARKFEAWLPNATENVDVLMTIHMRERSRVEAILITDLELAANLPIHIGSYRAAPEQQLRREILPAAK